MNDYNENKIYNFYLKRGKKEKIQKLYKNILVTIKKKMKLEPKEQVNNILKKLSKPLYVQKLSRYKSIIQYQNKSKQILNSLKFFKRIKSMPKQILKFHKSKTTYKKSNKNFYKVIKFHLPYIPYGEKKKNEDSLSQ